MTRISALVVGVSIALGVTLRAQGPQPPLTEKELINLIKQNRNDLQKVAPILNERGVDFDLTADIEKKLRKAGAVDPLIENVRNMGPTGRASKRLLFTSATGEQFQVSPDEARAYETIRSELDPDRAIQLVDDFEKKYPASPYLPYAYVFGARAFQQKNDVEKVVEYAEKGRKLRADNVMALITLVSVMPLPQFLRGKELQRERILSDVEAYAKQALDLVEQLTKQAEETDEQFAARKAMLASSVHAALGMTHLQRAGMGLQGLDKEELAKAEQEYKIAVTMSPTPLAEDFYRLGEALALDQKISEAIEAFTKAAKLGENTIIKAYAEQRIELLKKAQAGSKP